MDLPWARHPTPLARIGRDRPLTLYIAADGTHRVGAEHFIRQCFALHHGARIRQFMPTLLTLETADGELQGAVGLRRAEHNPLFLERYLDVPIEKMLRDRTGCAPARAEIVEVGNLAATGSGAARLLIVALTDLLIAMGQRWVAFTGTPLLLNSFQRLGLTPCPLGLADPARMGSDLPDWGTYYASHPQVMAGEIFGGHQRLLQLGVYLRLGYRPLYTEGVLPRVAGC